MVDKFFEALNHKFYVPLKTMQAGNINSSIETVEKAIKFTTDFCRKHLANVLNNLEKTKKSHDRTKTSRNHGV